MAIERRRYSVSGRVQGVGFRPFVFRLAQQLTLAGTVYNSAAGVEIEVEGDSPALDAFAQHLQTQAPAAAAITGLQVQHLPPQQNTGFHIASSHSVTDSIAPLPLPDRATCTNCLQEMNAPANRRYRYPFISCCDCGPRWTIQARYPFDRANTSMDEFVPCPACATEYADPQQRRFHAQNIACAHCGPQLQFLAADGAVLAQGEAALQNALTLLRDGQCIALQGIGGFQLLVDARQAHAVARLRQRKQRPHKPFALMVADLQQARSIAQVSDDEAQLLTSPAAPIVLLAKRINSIIAEEVAPGIGRYGVMLPSSPLHHLLLQDVGGPLVATSGNRSGEPLCSSPQQALQRLDGIADGLLVHNRAILNALDDAVVQRVANTTMVLRAARGYAPLRLDLTSGREILACGGHLKNCNALLNRHGLFVGPHIGDLDNTASLDATRQSQQTLCSLFGGEPAVLACDLHPDYASTRLAQASGLPLVQVQHHHAHAVSCMLEHGLTEPCLAIIWDGNGLGPDGTLWGGEFLLADAAGFQRLGHLRPFPLPGGEAAMRDPRRSLCGLLYSAYGHAEHWPLQPQSMTESDIALLTRLMERGLNAPLTSSVGRLFDAVAALLGLGQSNSFEAQAAMALQHAAQCWPDPVAALPFTVQKKNAALEMNWQPLLDALVHNLKAGTGVPQLAAQFHETLAAMATAVAQHLGRYPVVLGGGCFQNPLLLTRVLDHLQAANIQAYWPCKIPPNDGGLAAGQAAVAHQHQQRQLQEQCHVPGHSRPHSQYQR